MKTQKYARTGVCQSTTTEARERWNKDFGRFEHKYGTAPSKLAKIAVDEARLHPGMRVLEVGGGTGRNTMFFAKHGLDVMMVDISDVAVSLTCNVLAELPYADASTVIIRHDYFELLDVLKPLMLDAIFSNFCIQLIGQADREEFIHIARTLMRPDGLLILSFLSTFDDDYLLAKQGQLGHEIDYNTWLVRGHYQHFFDEDEVRHLLRHMEIAELKVMKEHELIISETRRTSFWFAVAKNKVNL